jgi:hypothetical protein
MHFNSSKAIFKTALTMAWQHPLPRSVLLPIITLEILADLFFQLMPLKEICPMLLPVHQLP